MNNRYDFDKITKGSIDPKELLNVAAVSYTHLYTRFFDPKRYDLAKAGRFKFKKKLSLLDRIAGRVLARCV